MTDEISTYYYRIIYLYSNFKKNELLTAPNLHTNISIKL